MLATFVHNLDPYVFRFFLEPRWYGFAYLLAFVAAYLILIRLARRGMLRMDPERVPDLVLNACIFGVLVGGRLGYCLFYDLPAAMREGYTPLLWKFSSSFPYWGALEVWRGGMAAHGGVVFTILALLYLARRYKVSIPNLGDAACMVVPIGLFLGRVANFINGELYGHPTTVAWAVKFPTELVTPTDNPLDLPIPLDKISPADAERMIAWANGLDPTLQVQSLADLARHNLLPQAERVIQTADAMKIVDWARNSMPSANITKVSDLVTQLQSGTAQVSEAIRGKFEAMATLSPRHPSQLYEALLEGALLFLIVWIIGHKWRRNGMASGAFLTFYPVMRIIGEQFRVGDDPTTLAGVTLSLGVWYSIAMLVPGVIYWAYWIRKNQKSEWVPVVAAAKPSDAKAHNDKRRHADKEAPLE